MDLLWIAFFFQAVGVFVFFSFLDFSVTPLKESWPEEESSN